MLSSRRWIFLNGVVPVLMLPATYVVEELFIFNLIGVLYGISICTIDRVYSNFTVHR
jgi:hypothetical protein